MLKQVFSGILAGLLVSLGGGVFLSVNDKVVGAVGFTIGLISVCYYGANLYTGRVGYLFEGKKGAVPELFLGLLGNLIGAVLAGLAMLSFKGEAAKAVCDAKLALSGGSAFVRGIFCGMLIYIAVNLYRDKKTMLGILFGIPVFILSGFEHSIADMFYFAAAGVFSLQAVLFIVIVAAGNAVGALLFDRILFFAGLKKGA